MDADDGWTRIDDSARMFSCAFTAGRDTLALQDAGKTRKTGAPPARDARREAIGPARVTASS